MSHTVKANNGSSFLYNGDLSGSVIIRAPQEDETVPLQEIEIPMVDLMQFYQNMVIRLVISQVESMENLDPLEFFASYVSQTMER